MVELAMTAICPNCRGELSESISATGVSWKCGACGGRAVGFGVLHKMLDERFVNRLWALARDRNGVAGRDCPMCQHTMLEVTLDRGHDATLALDVCRICEFVWFDPGKFELAPPNPSYHPADAEDQLSQKARELIAIHKVEEMAAARRDEGPDEVWKTIPAFFGLPVMQNSSTSETLPVLTWGMAAIICVTSIYAFSDLKNITMEFGLIPDEPFRKFGITWLTSFFLHGGWFHLVGNIYFLVLFGSEVEDVLSKGRWLVLLLAATLTGDVLHVMASFNSGIPSIGASGGISGLIAFYALQFPKEKLSFLTRYGYRWIQLPAWSAFLIWVGLQVWGAVKYSAGISSVASFAHLGGAAAGYVAWRLWRTDLPN